MIVALFIATGCERSGAPRAAETPLPNALVVLTWNIHAGLDGFDGVLAALRAQDCDVICLQETGVHSQSADGGYTARIAEATGLHFRAPGPGLGRGGDGETALLSRWPLRDILPLDAGTGRVYGVTAVTGEATRPLRLVSVHITSTYKFELSHAARTAVAREAEARDLAARLRFWPEPTVVAGDFNMPPSSPSALPLHAAASCVSTSQPTCPSASPLFELDYAFVTRGIGVSDVRRITTSASDHAIVRFGLRRPAVIK